jgi:hypothetical protein
VRQVLSTTDRSLVESLLIALDAEGIDAIASNDSGLPFIPVTVAVLDDADYERALAVLHSLQPTVHDSVPVAPWFRRGWRLALVLVLLLVLLLCIDSIG